MINICDYKQYNDIFPYPIFSIDVELALLKLNAVFIRISQCRLTSVPKQICNFHHLVYLQFSDNNITVFPDSLCVLTKLKTLYFYNNRSEEHTSELQSL